MKYKCVRMCVCLNECVCGMYASFLLFTSLCDYITDLFHDLSNRKSICCERERGEESVGRARERERERDVSMHTLV